MTPASTAQRIRISSGIGQTLWRLRPLVERVYVPGWRRVLARALSSGEGDQVVVLSTGVKMHISGGDRIQRLMAFRAYERRELAVMRSVLRPDSVVIDGGAHIGFFALHAARWCPRGSVYAFEPATEPFARLTEHVELNGYANLHPVRAALGDSDGRVTLHEVDVPGEGGWGSVLIDPSAVTKEIEVDQRSIDAFARQTGLTKVDFIKLDVQGAEFATLKGAQEVLTSMRPKVLAEVIDVWWGTKQTAVAGDVFDLMTGLGYTARAVTPFGLKPATKDTISGSIQNVLFAPGERG